MPNGECQQCYEEWHGINGYSLPSDPDEFNDVRAAAAEAAVLAFLATKGTDSNNAVRDLLCDLAHLLDRDSELGSMADGIRRAEDNYFFETGGDGKQFQNELNH